jgi:molybdenum cofactor biosynthesis enzyme MoaA
MSTSARSDAAPPQVPLGHLDHLWFQVAGTLCNLTCHHCFISCSPHNHAFGFLSRQVVQQYLEESVAWGVKEYYFTGGEPFLNPEMVPILCDTLAYGPATVLTNGTVLKPAWLKQLAAAEAASLYSLEIRVSIDGFTAQMNDPIRGEGTFERAMRGLKQLAAEGFLPLVTVARTWPEHEESEAVAGFVRLLQLAGIDRPRLKILPTLRLGAEVDRTGGYAADDRVTAEMLAGFDLDQLICHHSRIVTDRGVYVCPILIDSPEARLGDTLAGAAQPFAVTHGACHTCYLHGAICSNPSAAARPWE